MLSELGLSKAINRVTDSMETHKSIRIGFIMKIIKTVTCIGITRQSLPLVHKQPLR